MAVAVKLPVLARAANVFRSRVSTTVRIDGLRPALIGFLDRLERKESLDAIPGAVEPWTA
ncbi:hypothetical protein GCM10009574_040110 [Streptomyces asiaticus]|uniref:Uncharacterized protein n=2 Tax=Streptomyces rhizosphaericus TaxID=114699 RepID=A0ABN1Q4V3_9ACTN